MTNTLEKLQETYSRGDQQVKRDIGRFIYERPAQWIPRQTLVDYFDIDESGVSRHVEHLYEDEFIQKRRKTVKATFSGMVVEQGASAIG